MRTRKQDEHTAKRNEILDVALQLLYTKGYDRMTIQDILDRLQISKGAFYHYFDSKVSVLEALVERMAAEQIGPLLQGVVHDPNLTALQKLQGYFDTAVRWKTAKKDFVMELVRVWYSDQNALARQKMYAIMISYVTPLFVEIIQQGIQEGVFTTRYPEYISQINIGLIQSLGDSFALMILANEKKPDPRAARRAEAMLAACNDALERVLGAPLGSIHMMDAASIREWFPEAGEPASQVEAPVGQVDIPAPPHP